MIFVFLLFGAIAYFGLNMNLQPDVQIPYVTISTVYPGAGPKEIETLISKRIEETVSTISQIERVESYSLDGVSIVFIEFKIGKNVDVANQEVKDKVDEILNKLPDNAEQPIIQKIDFRAFPVIEVLLSGNLDPRELWEIADKTLKDRFSQIEGVGNINITGGQEREIKVILDNRVAYENSISLPQLLGILQAYNMNIPGGYFQLDDQEYTVRLEGELNNIQTMLDMQIPTPFGNKKLRQFASILDTGKDVRQRAVYFNNIDKVKNENVVRMGIVKSIDGNVVRVSDAVRAAVPEINQELPPGCTLEIIQDASEFVRSSVNDTMSNVYLGVLFTAIILFFFLHNIRSTIIVALSMPTSIISTFMLLKAFGLTLNMMTLMGLSVSVGVLVANSIVVIENIFRYRNMGRNNKEAAYEGTSEVMVAVMASTLTNIVVFLPIANMSSIVGQYLRELALAATFATIFSLIFSFTLTPMLASLILPKKSKEGRISAAFEAFFNKWDDIYRSMLRVVLKNKIISGLIIIATFVVFILVTMFYGSKLGFEFLPTMDDGKLKVTVELNQGTNLSETAKILNEIETRLKKHPEIKFMVTNLGLIDNLNTGTNLAKMEVQLVDAKERTTRHTDMIGVFVKELADIPNAKIIVDVNDDMGEGGSPIQFYLMGQDLAKMEEIKEKVIATIKDVPGLINLDNSSRPGKPEITVYPKREILSDLGLTVSDVALTLRSSIEGIESSKYREKGNEYDIVVTLTNESVDTPEKIGNITVVSPRGSFRLAQIADIKFTNGYTRILHREKYTTIKFDCSNAPTVPMGNVTSEIDKRLKTIDLPSGYHFRWGGTTKMMNEMVNDMMFAFMIAIILTYLLLCAMLESFIQPIYIMMTIPLSLIGVFIFLYYANVSFGITSMMGIIMLIGIVVNNAILMLDYVNQLRREQGMLPKDALIEGAPTKLRPQIMSTIALILGMLPMALGIGDAGAEMRVPLGIVSIGGLFAATLLTLFVIPTMYYVFSRSRVKIKSF